MRRIISIALITMVQTSGAFASPPQIPEHGVEDFRIPDLSDQHLNFQCGNSILSISFSYDKRSRAKLEKVKLDGNSISNHDFTVLSETFARFSYLEITAACMPHSLWTIILEGALLKPTEQGDLIELVAYLINIGPSSVNVSSYDPSN